MRRKEYYPKERLKIMWSGELIFIKFKKIQSQIYNVVNFLYFFLSPSFVIIAHNFFFVIVISAFSCLQIAWIIQETLFFLSLSLSHSLAFFLSIKIEFTRAVFFFIRHEKSVKLFFFMIVHCLLCLNI